MPGTIYHSGPFTVNTRLRTFLREGNPQPITPKVFDILLLFVQSGNRTVSRDELASALWPGQIATEANLNQHVSMLRRLLADGQDGNRYLITLPGRGYQWVLPVQTETETETTLPPEIIKTNPRFRNWIAATLATAAFGSLLAVMLMWAKAPRISSGIPLDRHALTRLPGSVYQPAFSKDGTKIAFIWDQEGQHGPGVFVKGPEDDEPRQVSAGDVEHSSPAWSPDGRQLAYLRHRADGIDLVVRPEKGGDERTVASLYRSRYGMNCRHLDWSPDGSAIVVDDKLNPNEPFGLFLVQVESGAHIRLTKSEEDIIGDVDPRFSPDGMRISFVRMTDRFRMEVHTIDLASRATNQQTSDRKVISGQDWSADGRRIYLGSNRAGEFQIWSTALDGTPPLATGISSPKQLQLSVSRTGSRLAYSDVLPDPNIWRLDLQGQAENWTRIVGSTGEDILPQISPDGKKLCFRSDRSGEGQLWLSYADGSHPTQLTHGSIRPVAGRWSPDSRMLVFNDAADQRIFAVSATGGSPFGLAGTGSHPVFSADGQSVYFNHGGISQVPLNAKEPKALLPSHPVHQKFLSSDGRWLYFSGGRTDTVIWKYNFGTQVVSKVLDGLIPGYWGAWALSVKGIYYLATDPEPLGGAAIFLQPGDGKARKRIAHFPGPLPPIGTSMWSLTPDDRYLYCVRVDLSHSDLTIVNGIR